MNEEGRRIECLRLLEETGDFAVCMALYPEMREELAALRVLETERIAAPRAAAEAASRQAMLTALGQSRKSTSSRTLSFLRNAVAVFGAAGLLAAGTIGAGAAQGMNDQGFVNDVLSAIGVVEQAEPHIHGRAVSDAVHKAKEILEEGEKQGDMVSRAACEAAHDRTNLPAGAQNAPGQQGKEAKGCDKVDSVEDGTEDVTVETQDSSPVEKDNDKEKAKQVPTAPISNAGGSGNGNPSPGNPNPGDNDSVQPSPDPETNAEPEPAHTNNAGGNGNGDPNPGNPNAGGNGNGDPNPGNPNAGGNGNGDPNPGNPNAGGNGNGDPNPGNPNAGGNGNGNPNPGNPNAGGNGNGNPNPGNPNASGNGNSNPADKDKEKP